MGVMLSLIQEILPPINWRLANLALAPQEACVKRFMWGTPLALGPQGFVRTKVPSLKSLVKLADSRSWQFILLVEIEDLPQDIKVDQQEIDLIAFCTFLAKIDDSGQTEPIRSVKLSQTGADWQAQAQLIQGAQSEYQQLLARQKRSDPDFREPLPDMTLLVNIRHPNFLRMFDPTLS